MEKDDVDLYDQILLRIDGQLLVQESHTGAKRLWGQIEELCQS